MWLAHKSSSSVSTELLNMGRNLRIAGAMLCMTIVIHVMIYHKETTNSHVQYMYNTAGHNVTPFIPQKYTKTLGGDGSLYKEIALSTAPFVEAFPKQLVILGYQRVGSSFLGQIFDQNPNFFYMYEPLDAVYAEMYGTEGGLNVPSDITYLSNGTVRSIPQDEKDAVEILLTDILNCNVHNLPAGFLLHKYWYFLMENFMPSWLPYRTCLKRLRVLRAREECAKIHLSHVCPRRFGMAPLKQEYCKEGLARSKVDITTPFGKYKLCLNVAFHHAKPCYDIYQKKCSEATLRSAKTVRGTMDEMDDLLKNNPNMRLIHLIRDPRPVAVSRYQDYSFRGIYSGNITQKKGGDKIKEAQVYCGTVTIDILHRKTLEKQYPGRIIQVIYEDFVQHPTEYAKAIYKFLDEPLPLAIMSWIHNKTVGPIYKENAVFRMNAWKQTMTYHEGEKILSECARFYNLVDYKWPYHEA